MLELSVKKSKAKKKKVFKIEEYPRSKCNKDKLIVQEKFVTVYGEEYLQRVYEDGAGDLTRYNDETENWVLLTFPATVDEKAEDKIRSVIRHNFDISLCLPRENGEKLAV